MKIKKIDFTSIPMFLALFLAYAISSSSGYSFEFIYFGNGTDLITFNGDAEYGPEPDGMSKSGGLGLTQDKIKYSHGQGLFINPIPFKANSSYVYSFKTEFTFSITPQNKTNPPGHGLAFIIVPTDKNNDVSGLGYLGILKRRRNGNPNNHIFAVEFDVFQDKSLGDINGNHVGININSVNSTVSTKAGYWIQSKTGGKNGLVFKELKLNDMRVYKAWIEYENSMVRVSISPSYYEKPKRPLIEARVDLSKVLLEKMYVGFAGSMGRGVERHDIWDWSFQNSAKN